MIDQQSGPDMDGRQLAQLPRRYPVTTVYLLLAVLVISAVVVMELIR